MSQFTHMYCVVVAPFIELGGDEGVVIEGRLVLEGEHGEDGRDCAWALVSKGSVYIVGDVRNKNKKKKKNIYQ